MQRLEGREPIETLNVKYTTGRCPVLVLSHGFGCDQSVWQNVISNLRKDARLNDCGVLTYDLAFSGKVGRDYYTKYSDRYQIIYGYVEDIVSILQFYNISQCLFVGHGISGMVGMLASIRHIDLISQLVLIGTAPCFVDKPGYKIGYSVKKSKERLDLMQVDYEKFVEGYIEIALPGNTKDKFKSKMKEMLSRTTPDVAKSMTATTFKTDIRDILPYVEVPCTLILSNSNTVATAFAQKYMIKNMKNASTTIAKVKTRGHLPHLTAGKEVVMHISLVIQEWVTKHEPSSSVPPSGRSSYERLLEENRVLTQEMERQRFREEMLTQENMLLKRQNEALKNQQLELPEITANFQDYNLWSSSFPAL